MKKIVKVLYGAAGGMPLTLNVEEYESLKNNGVELLTFGTENADIVIDPIQHDYSYLEEALKARLFVPDFILIMTGGYDFLMEGIENSQYPVFLLNIEWFLTTQNLYYESGRVDYIVTALGASAQYVKSITGKEPIGISLPSLVDRWPPFHHLPDEKKVYDVAYVGNTNPRIHYLRTKFIEKVALLPEKYNVFVGETVSNGKISFEQANLINNQSKICINFSNPFVRAVCARIQHTLLSGSFVLTEHLEDEKDFLIDGINCAFYTNGELEAKIAYYLKNEEKREKIAKTGHELALSGKFNFTNILLKYINKLSSCAFEKTKPKRSFNDKPRFQQLSDLGKEAMLSSIIVKEEGIRKILGYFYEALELSPENPEIINNIAVAFAIIAISNPNDENWKITVEHWFDMGGKIKDVDIIRLFNEACYYRKISKWDKYCQTFFCLNEINSISDEKLLPFFPHLGFVLALRTDFFSSKKWQQLFLYYLNNGKVTPEFYNQAKKYILWKINEWMAELLIEQGKCHAAASYYKEAYNEMPDADMTIEQLGFCLYTIGELSEAKDAYEKCLELNPFNINAAVNLCNILFTLGERDRGKELARKYKLICQRISTLQAHVSHFEPLLVS